MALFCRVAAAPYPAYKICYINELPVTCRPGKRSATGQNHSGSFSVISPGGGCALPSLRSFNL